MAPGPRSRNISRFGTGTSAGPAAQELLGRSTAQQFGQIGQTATAGRTDIEGERTRVKTFTAQKKVELEQQKQEAIRNLQQEFRQGLLKINQMKAQNESAKAQARYDLLEQAQQQAYQIEQADKAYQRAIDMFEKEKASNLAQVGAYASQQTIGADTANAIQNILVDPRYQTKAQRVVALYGAGIDPKVIGTITSAIPEDPKEDQNLTF